MEMEPISINKNFIRNKIQKESKNIGENIIENVTNYALKYIVKEISTAIGKSYTFESNSGILDDVTMKFLKKHDKKFHKHTVQISSNTYRYKNIQVVLKLEFGTYCYIASGTSIAGAEKLMMLESGLRNTDLYLYIFGFNYNKYVEEIENIVESSFISKDSIGIFNVDIRRDSRGTINDLSITYKNITPRNEGTIFFSNNEKEDIIKHIDKFKSNERFYKDRQIIYKTGILLYGKPGTGKSSLAKLIASLYNRSIININVANFKDIDIATLTQSIDADTVRKYIILLEDIDTLYLNREDIMTDKDELAVTNKLLQFLDSNTSPNDVIFVATTNHIEKLDEALLREGRFDLKVNIQGLNENDALDFCRSFNLDDETSKEAIKEALIRRNDSADKNQKEINQSLLQSIILSKIENKGYKIEEIEQELKELNEEA